MTPPADSAAAQTLPQLLRLNAQRFAERPALREKEFGIWQSFTWAQFYERVRHFSLGLRELGLAEGDRVAILGDNRPEWIITELAVQAAGAVSMGVYQDSVAEELQFLMEFSAARFLVAEDQEQVDKILEVREHLRHLEHVIYYDSRGLGNYGEELLRSFPDVEALGKASALDDFEDRVEAGQASDLAILSTTSGTTGKPKLAMLTHGNVLSMARTLQATDPMTSNDDFVSYLPLAWIGEQMTAVSAGLLVGFAINFPEEPETVQIDISEIGPTTMFAPPRIWENMVSEIQVKIEDTSWLKRRVYDWAMSTGYEAADRGLSGEGLPGGLRFQRFLAEWLCFQWIKDKYGLRRMRRAYTGGAALGPDIFRFFHALGVNLKQIYGQTEVAGISVAHRDDAIKFETVGQPLDGTEIRIGDDGEILARGPSVFIGYYENTEATAETLQEGWLHSGDAGYFDDDGHLVVIDRKKDVMTLGDGTRFSPQFIENKLKFSPYVREAVVFGGGDYDFITALVTIDYANAGKWAEKRQLPYTTFTDLSQKLEIYGLVRDHVDETNAVLPESARICRFLLLHKELDADDAELTRTRKVRRGFVAERYRELVTALYGSDESVAVQSEINYQDGSTAMVETQLTITTLDHHASRGSSD
ncbi:MAG: AMP-binding protein [Acidobacteriota bacterium]